MIFVVIVAVFLVLAAFSLLPFPSTHSTLVLISGKTVILICTFMARIVVVFVVILIAALVNPRSAFSPAPCLLHSPPHSSSPVYLASPFSFFGFNSSSSVA